jgi:GxxExxY protein
VNKNIIYQEESFRLIGFAYNVFNELGYGFAEKVYCAAYEKLLQQNKIPFVREKYCAIKINGDLVAKNYFDFLIDDKIVLELKVGDNDYKKACDQLFKYLKAGNLKLGIIIRITRDGVKIKRIVNLY